MRLITRSSEQEGGRRRGAWGEPVNRGGNRQLLHKFSNTMHRTSSTPISVPLSSFQTSGPPSAISEKIPHISPTGKISCTAPSKGRVASCNLLSAVDAHCNALQGEWVGVKANVERRRRVAMHCCTRFIFPTLSSFHEQPPPSCPGGHPAPDPLNHPQLHPLHFQEHPPPAISTSTPTSTHVMNTKSETSPLLT